MKCQNTVPYYVPRGMGKRKILIQCGKTDPMGNRARCSTCASDPVISHRLDMERHAIEEANALIRSAGYRRH